ncbi:DUF4862 family protein [Boudabousia marimammalium]|uniref:DUF4862 domain-containing protein n=1 Tax=Boudabousia marimammalium TaxID=156892 RepID=A0A1Q5PSB0_9ACTO|nr:DUF4862 family protein [Boudabousia marimammalium]OKL50446.1 hypothetical protein BM477_00255 [Boudabousia marimammalium]
MKLTVGAYPIYPNPEQSELGTTAELLQQLSAKPRVGGYEIPYRGSAAPQYWNLTWPEGAAADSHLVLTGIPITMMMQGSHPGLGLASPTEDGRAAALELNRELHARVEALTAAGHQVKAVQIHSAPKGGGSEAAFAQSLKELVTWDWHGAALTVEHCDSASGTVAPEKGFLDLGQELAAITQVYEGSQEEAEGAARVRLGVSVNWARSVLETGSVETPLEHLGMAREAGLLRGYMASGIDPQDSAFGPGWVDGHLPVAGLGGAADSALLTPELLVKSWAAAGDDLVFKGFKMSLRPESLTVAQRLGLYDQIMELIPA